MQNESSMLRLVAFESRKIPQGTRGNSLRTPLTLLYCSLSEEHSRRGGRKCLRRIDVMKFWSCTACFRDYLLPTFTSTARILHKQHSHILQHGPHFRQSVFCPCSMGPWRFFVFDACPRPANTSWSATGSRRASKHSPATRGHSISPVHLKANEFAFAVTAVLLILIAIIFPPVAAGMLTGCSCDLLINIALTLLG
jgi:uncharacterized membrane protein YqaE (UPF0057 family)